MNTFGGSLRIVNKKSFKRPYKVLFETLFLQDLVFTILFHGLFNYEFGRFSLTDRLFLSKLCPHFSKG
jgi:hypothetical protein